MKKIRIEAVYQDGVLKPEVPLDLSENSRVHLVIELEPQTEDRPSVLTAWSGAIQKIWHFFSASMIWRDVRLVFQSEWFWFGLAVLVYTLTRLWSLEEFPVYFFTDEAIHPVLGMDLIRKGFRDFEDTFLPAFFKHDLYWNLSLSVYIHALTASFFGMSIFVTRATSAMISLLGTVAVGLILKEIFRHRFWWVSILLLTITPAWFLHSRTAFEVVMSVAFYACFLLFYLLYRYRSPRYLFPALLFGAATFYAYANGQIVMVGTAVLLFIFDFSYHWQQRRIIAIGMVVMVLLAVPYFRFHLTHPGTVEFHLRMLDSYWFHPLPFQEKLRIYLLTYLRGLNPMYWFVPDQHELIRHVMKGYPHLPTIEFPLILAGFVFSLRQFHSSAHRVLIVASLASPLGVALVDIGITRLLFFIIPATLLACLGLEELLSRVRFVQRKTLLNLVLLVGLSWKGLWMLYDALHNGPLWFNDYGLYGLQWGVRPLFTEIIPEYLKRDSKTRILVSPAWANGAWVFPEFFISAADRPRVQLLNVDYFLSNKQPLDRDMLHIMLPSEYERALTSGKFKWIQVERILNYPDGSPGFYFVRLAYVDDIDAIFAAEKAERRKIIEEQINFDNQVIQVRYSVLGDGQIANIFDGDWFTLIRGLEANPFVLEFIFPEPRSITGIAGAFGSMDFRWTIELYPSNQREPLVYSHTYRNLPPDPHVEMTFSSSPVSVARIRMQILNIHAGEEAQIHVREITFR